MLSFPDMEPDGAIEQLAKHKDVYVIWGVANLLEDLEEIVRGRSVSDALPMERIADEVLAATDGLIRLGATAEGEAGHNPSGSRVLSLWWGGREILRVGTKLTARSSARGMYFWAEHCPIQNITPPGEGSLIM